MKRRHAKTRESLGGAARFPLLICAGPAPPFRKRRRVGQSCLSCSHVRRDIASGARHMRRQKFGPKVQAKAECHKAWERVGVANVGE